MKNEIDKAHYCGGDKIECEYADGPCSGSDCGYHHHKWPTPEQYKAEYGEEWPDDACVYYTSGTAEHWIADIMGEAKTVKSFSEIIIVCACSPFGRPPDGWRPDTYPDAIRKIKAAQLEYGIEDDWNLNAVIDFLEDLGKTRTIALNAVAKIQEASDGKRRDNTG